MKLMKPGKFGNWKLRHGLPGKLLHREVTTHANEDLVFF
jgi:hypothetical protein